MGEMWKSLGLWAGKAIKYYDPSLMDHSFGSLEDKNAERNMDSGSLADEVLKGTRTLSGIGAGVPFHVLFWQRI